MTAQPLLVLASSRTPANEPASPGIDPAIVAAYADIELASTEPTAEADNDIEFFVNIMHAKTLIGRVGK